MYGAVGPALDMRIYQVIEELSERANRLIAEAVAAHPLDGALRRDLAATLHDADKVLAANTKDANHPAYIRLRRLSSWTKFVMIAGASIPWEKTLLGATAALKISTSSR